MTTVTFNIPGINCGHCENTIKMEVSDMPGVTAVEASSQTKTATITFDAPATSDSIKTLLAEINYPVAD
jgi:copper chaperone CopZ